MTGPTGADQQGPGRLDIDAALAEQERLYLGPLDRLADIAAELERIERERLAEPPEPPPAAPQSGR